MKKIIRALTKKTLRFVFLSFIFYVGVISNYNAILLVLGILVIFNLIPSLIRRVAV